MAPRLVYRVKSSEGQGMEIRTHRLWGGGKAWGTHLNECKGRLWTDNKGLAGYTKLVVLDSGGIQMIALKL